MRLARTDELDFSVPQRQTRRRVFGRYEFEPRYNQVIDVVMPLLYAERKSTCRNDGRAGRCDNRYLEGVGGRSISDPIRDQEKVGENEDLGRQATFVCQDSDSHDVRSQSESEADGRQRHREFERESENISV